MECALEERSARGYCPGEEGHAEEVCGTHELSGVPCEVQDGEPVFVESTETPITELPFTGADPLLGVLGSVSLAVGVVLARWGLGFRTEGKHGKLHRSGQYRTARTRSVVKPPQSDTDRG